MLTTQSKTTGNTLQQCGTGTPEPKSTEATSADGPHKHQNQGILTIRNDKNKRDRVLTVSGNFTVS